MVSSSEQQEKDSEAAWMQDFSQMLQDVQQPPSQFAFSNNPSPTRRRTAVQKDSNNVFFGTESQRPPLGRSPTRPNHQFGTRSEKI